jgi:hypothetical protein
MKRKLGILIAVFIAALMCLPVYAQNQDRKIKNGYAEPKDPLCEIVRVRYGRSGGGGDATLASGTVVMWDTNSADGVTISACTSAWAGEARTFAGVLITDALTDDNAIFDVQDYQKMAYMCVRGYCLAMVDTSLADTGSTLVPSTELNGYFGTGTKIPALSQDNGILLTDTGTDGQMKVYIH